MAQDYTWARVKNILYDLFGTRYTVGKYKFMGKNIIRKRDVYCRIAYFFYLDRNFVINGGYLFSIFFFTKGNDIKYIIRNNKDIF